MNNDCWLLAVIVVNCVAAAMAIVDGGDSGRFRRWWRRD
jgi:hypothetical protein